jgi:hypothetical protein
MRPLGKQKGLLVQRRPAESNLTDLRLGLSLCTTSDALFAFTLSVLTAHPAPKRILRRMNRPRDGLAIRHLRAGALR